ncbi:unnamed protein product [Symbiodinium natans]|uniref:PPM-type phosphatase domain-containing protein n=1 Tax=Symbiodinium natans TaxID=878477 RepID=A0A812QPM8_9DINO|nr:unnamed protein product [Symbiodinium natans]
MGASNNHPTLPAERFAKGVPDSLDWRSLMDVLFQPCHQAVLMYTSDQELPGPQRHLRKEVKTLRCSESTPLQETGMLPAGMVSQKGNKLQPNQDSAFYFHFVDSDGSRIWCACVLDGHGPLGHEMSALGMQWLPLLILREPLLATDAGRLIPSDPQTVFTAIQAAFQKIGRLMQKASETGWGPRGYSGATCTLAFCAHGLLHTANVGDSRMILGTLPAPSASSASGQCEPGESPNSPKSPRESAAESSGECRVSGVCDCRVLTRDHKPEDPDERLRIEQLGGIVARQRVYLDEWPYVGLNMSRSLGDAKLHAVGVSHVPDVATVFLESAGGQSDGQHPESIGLNLQFLVAASDGVWDFTACDEAAQLVGQKLEARRRQQTDKTGVPESLDDVCAALVLRAQRAWEAECPDLDDITAIVVCIEPEPPRS